MFKIVLSDLHLGAGGAGNRLEDFRHDAELAALLDDLALESESNGQELEVILNGDAFEFWQVPALPASEAFDPRARYRDRLYLGTKPAECARRMELIARGHPGVFDALRRLLCATPPRRTVTIIKGNHDLQLHWPAVQQMLRDALDAHGERECCLTFVPRALERDGLYLEHGNQQADALSRHPFFDDPIDPRDPGRLIETPGARIFVHAINRLERDLPWISSVKPMTAIVWFLLRFQPLLALRLIWLFLPALPTLLRVHRPLSRSNRDLQHVVARAPARAAVEELPAADARTGHSAQASEAVLVLEGALARDPILSRGLLEEGALHAGLVSTAAGIAQQRSARVVLFGHTHVPIHYALADGSTYLNTGTWNWELDLHGQPADAWRRLIRTGDMGGGRELLTYVRVDYAGGVPVPSLLIFRDSDKRAPGST